METNKISSIEIIAAFNKLKSKPYISTKDLEISKSYKILSMQRQKNKYGDVVIAELEDGMLYLPKRYNKLEDDVINGCANEKLILKKKEENGVQVLELEEEKYKDTEVEGEFREFFIPNTQPYFSWEKNKMARNS